MNDSHSAPDPIDLWAHAVHAKAEGDDATFDILWRLFVALFEQLPEREQAIITAAIVSVVVEQCGGWPTTH